MDPFGVVSREIGNKKARKNGRGRERERRKGISRLQEKDRPDFFLIFFFFFHNPSRIIIIIIIIKNMPQLQVQGWPVAFSILTLAT